MFIISYVFLGTNGRVGSEYSSHQANEAAVVEHVDPNSSNIHKKPRDIVLHQREGETAGIIYSLVAIKRLCPLESWDSGFESHSRHGCLSVFILCLYR
jgi:hypothetical protein